jgi:hypothetical protein
MPVYAVLEDRVYGPCHTKHLTAAQLLAFVLPNTPDRHTRFLIRRYDSEKGTYFPKDQPLSIR